MNWDSQNTPLTETVHLKKYFDTGSGVLRAADGVDLIISPQKTLDVIGEPGYGKSTLGRVIFRPTSATERKMLCNGRSIPSCSPSQLRELRKEMQIIFQDLHFSLSPHTTISELIAGPLMTDRVVKNKAQLRERVVELIGTVGLAPRLGSTYPHESDGGRRQRIGIARTLSVNPKPTICDESVSALDVSIQTQILNLLMDFQDSMGLTYIFTTHDLSVVCHISDEIAVMYLGQCAKRCESKELSDSLIHPHTKVPLDAIQVSDISLREKREPTIRGEAISPIGSKPGCRLATRCPLATDEYWGSPIPLREVSADHLVIHDLVQQ